MLYLLKHVSNRGNLLSSFAAVETKIYIHLKTKVFVHLLENDVISSVRKHYFALELGLAEICFR